MAGPGLHQVQRLSLTQTLAPQLQQSLHLLQIPALELRTAVQQELQINPTLEEVPQELGDVSIEAEKEKTDGAPESSKDEMVDFQKDFEILAKLDEEWRDYFSQTYTYSGRSQVDEEKRQFFFDSIVQHESLQEHLVRQLSMSDFPQEKRKVAELIIGSTDDRGFLTTTPEDLSITTGIKVEDLREALDYVQSFHPVGVGARDLKECLLIQLKRLGKGEGLEAKIVNNHLDQLGRKRYTEIASALGTNVDAVLNAASIIATLEPRPGRIFSNEPDHYITPDVQVQKLGDEWVIFLNDEQIPRLRISTTYKELMSQEEGRTEVKDYIREKIRSGKFLIKSIHQRQQTIQNIASEIVKVQKDFLEKGIAYLRPLTMSQIAQKVGVHETTVSRAVANKYMQTPHGVFEMKYFFTPGFTTDTGECLSNKSIKDTIGDIVSKEDPHKPLSDQEIVALLAEKGIKIARRTVAKYRDELNILPSNLRKQYN